MPSPSDRQSTFDGLSPRLRENLTALERRILELSDLIERDRREPGKVTGHVLELRAAVFRAEASRRGDEPVSLTRSWVTPPMPSESVWLEDMAPVDT
jgi:hypothetical protein